jgi:uncharacterized protein involved in exopolysaccharide biosynthesis
MSSTDPSDPIAAHADEPEVSLLDLLLTLLANWRLVVLTPLLLGLLALGVTFLMKPRFTATTQIMTPQQQQTGVAAMLGSLGGLAGAAGGLAGLKNPADQWIGMLKSRTIQDAMVDRFGLMKHYDAEYRFHARQGLEGSTIIKAGKDGLISVSVEDTDPDLARQMADAYIEELRKLSTSMALTEASQRRLFFETQLKQARDRLIEAETALRGSGVNESVLKTQPEAAVGALAQLKAQITASEVRLTVMRDQYAPDSAELKAAQTELASLRSQLGRAEQADGSSAKGAGSDYVQRYRMFKYYEMLFELLAKQYELAKSDESRDGAVIQVVDKAVLPEWKSSPKRGQIAVLVTALSALLLSVFVLARQALRNAMERDSAFADKLGQLRGMLRLPTRSR